MSETPAELVQEYDVDAELVEALLIRYADLDEPSADPLPTTHKVVYEFLDPDGDAPIRTLEDHFYQLQNHSDYGDDASAPQHEVSFEAVVTDLVTEGLVARTDEEPPRYSASLYRLLADLDREWTASGIDEFCATTGVDKCQVYYHILTDLGLDVDLTQ